MRPKESHCADPQVQFSAPCQHPNTLLLSILCRALSLAPHLHQYSRAAGVKTRKGLSNASRAATRFYNVRDLMRTTSAHHENEVREG